MLLIALGVWWNANTVAHHFIHRPFFRHRLANHACAAALSVLLGFPQSLWRERHLAHHAGAPRRVRISGEMLLQAALVLLVWAAMATRAPAFFLTTYLPGYGAGLLLCALHGHYEHAGGMTSYYGALYNALLFNDGYHVEHHANPGIPWNRLPEHRAHGARVSRWPAPLRWMERLGLDGLERLVLHSTVLQRYVVRAHARALRPLVATLPPVPRVTIVGGGLFPRSCLVLSALLPSARITIVDANADNLARAGVFVDPVRVDLVHARFAEGNRSSHDLVVIPLSFDGDRASVYAHPPAPATIVHDWIWRKRGDSRIVSIALLKRINLVRA
ncbi:MAG TPA: fatty acid desaturase [Vicinamibacterales bacterium]|nr:fatty acid desaturase [Vicinamibacterales bacterium]